MDLVKLEHDITEILVRTIYSAAYGAEMDNGMAAVHRFQNDAKFHAVVRKQVSLIMHAIFEARQGDGKTS